MCSRAPVLHSLFRIPLDAHPVSRILRMEQLFYHLFVRGDKAICISSLEVIMYQHLRSADRRLNQVN
jgi:hypothetical protein